MDKAQVLEYIKNLTEEERNSLFEDINNAVDDLAKENIKTNVISSIQELEKMYNNPNDPYLRKFCYVLLRMIHYERDKDAFNRLYIQTNSKEGEIIEDKYYLNAFMPGRMEDNQNPFLFNNYSVCEMYIREDLVNYLVEKDFGSTKAWCAWWVGKFGEAEYIPEFFTDSRKDEVYSPSYISPSNKDYYIMLMGFNITKWGKGLIDLYIEAMK